MKKSTNVVDLFKTQENTFVRIVDYKTGGKDFNLGEVFYGLNMQMLIYLLTIQKNGIKGINNLIPAGILYRCQLLPGQGERAGGHRSAD